MDRCKIVPINRNETSREKIVEAVGRILAAKGFAAFNIQALAEEAGVPVGLVFRLFGSLENAVKAYAESPDFWPPLSELVGIDPGRLASLGAEAQVAEFLKSFMAALRARPQTLDVLAWEALEKNRYSEILEDARIRRALEYFEFTGGDFPDHVDLSAVVVLLAGAGYHLSMRSRLNRTFGGLDLHSEQGIERIEGAVDLLMRGLFKRSG